MSIRAIARVHVTIELTLTQPWGEDFTIATIHKQAKSEARSILGNMAEGKPHPFTLKGDPTVQITLIED